MPLEKIQFEPWGGPLPEAVRDFLRRASERTEEFVRSRFDDPVPGFVPSDHECVYRGLRALVEGRLVRGETFLEWGAGLGVASGLASMLDLSASGIEIDPDLCAAAEEFLADSGLSVEMVGGSFIPRGSEGIADLVDGPEWLGTGAPPAYEDLDSGIEDYDIVFAYPWPGEEGVVEQLFEDHGGLGALLVTYRGIEELVVQRRVRRRARS